MLDLSTAASFQEGDILFSDSQSDAKLILGQSALSAALCKAVSQSDWGDRDPKTKDATLNLRRTFERADSSGLQRPHITATVLPELKEQLPNMKMPQHVSMVFRRGDFVPPHEMTQDDSMGKSLPADSAFLSSSLAMPFRPGSVMEGKGRKLAGLDAVRFRNAIMRQTGFIEPECSDFSINNVTAS